MFLAPQKINDICWYVQLADIEVRNDLVNGYIKDENDYTSNLTGCIRRNINTYNTSGIKVKTFLLEPKYERRFGCDATIIIHNGTEAKIVLFEAKWPRFSQKNYCWDYSQTATGLSHFSDQLHRQSRLNPNYAVFEIFYNEFDFGKEPCFLNPFGSSCFWSTDAIGYKNSRSKPDDIWDQNELSSMLSQNKLIIADVLGSICECKVGRPIPIKNDPSLFIQEFKLEDYIVYIDASENPNT